jgi:hypothetical protein
MKSQKIKLQSRKEETCTSLKMNKSKQQTYNLSEHKKPNEHFTL